MSNQIAETTSEHRARWAAIGAAVAISLGAGGFGIASATIDSGERAVFIPITPCRVMDTRPAPETVGPRGTPIGPDETHSIPVLGSNGQCTIPADALGLALNVTVVNPTAASFLTVFPGGATLPLASNLNWTAGQAPVPNAVTADIGAGGQVSFFNKFGTVDVVADIVGYYVDHTHDDRYYTKAEVDALVEHNHDDRYYTKPEADTLVGVAAYDVGQQAETLTTTDTVYRTVAIHAPRAGTVIVNSGGYVWHANASAFIARCSITTGSAIDTTVLQYAESPAAPIGTSEVIGGTRGFDVAPRTTLTVNLVCDVSSGQANLSDSSLSAIFVPT